MRNRRMISRTISSSEKVHQIDWKARLLFTWMILHCDDEGRIEGSASTIKARVLPMADCTLQEIDKWLTAMKKTGLILWYKIDGKKYIQVVQFNEFQTFHGIQKHQSRLPSPPSMVDGSTPNISNISKEVSKERPEFANAPRTRRGQNADFSDLKNIGSKLVASAGGSL